MVFAELEPVLLSCDDSSSCVLANGNRFVRHLPDQGPIAFLHCLYGPASAAVRSRVKIGMGRSLPTGVEDFLTHANGAALFDKTIHIYGYVDVISRSVSLEDQTAISLLFENQAFARASQRWTDGWVRVGAVTGWETSLSLEAHVSGRCAIVAEAGATVECDDFAGMMRSIVDRIAPCFTCSGVSDKSYAELEAAIGSLIRYH